MKVDFRVTADDFGYCAERDAGILQAVRNGCVTHVSALVNGASLRESLKTCECDGLLSVGLHFNLTEGAPTLPPHTIPSLVDAESGLFLGKHALASASFARCDVERELRAQWEELSHLLGRRPTHIDGHNHCHVFEPVSSLLAELAGNVGKPVVCTCSVVIYTATFFLCVQRNGLYLMFVCHWKRSTRTAPTTTHSCRLVQ